MIAQSAQRTAGTCPRPRVARKLQAARRRRIVFVHGPAGCGKSRALAEAAAATVGPCVAFCVRHEHVRLARFARALVESVAFEAPELPHLLSAAYSSLRRRAYPWLAIAAWLAEQLPRPLTIVVDQLHRADTDEIAEFLVRLIEASGPEVTWLLGARSTTSFPLARWLAADVADVSVDEGVLTMQPDEDASLAAVLDLPPRDVARLRAAGAAHIGPMLDAAYGRDAAWAPLASHAVELVALAALPDLDDALLAQLDPQTSAVFETVVRTVTAAAARTTGERGWVLDESVRERAHALARTERTTLTRGAELAARALERAGRTADALASYVDARSAADVLRILDASGFELTENGKTDVAGAAIGALSPNDRRLSVLALTLEATDESHRGRYDVAESWFQHALGLARDDRQRLLVDIAYALDLLRRGRGDAVERLEALAAVATDPAHGVAVIASLGTAYAAAGRLDEAKACIARALAGLDAVADVAVRASVHHRAAFVALTAGDEPMAERHAEVAATLAREHGNDELLAVARSVTYVVAISYQDDQRRASEALRAIEVAGARLGNGIFVRFALIGAYLIHAERGEREALERLDARLGDEELEASIQHTDEGLLPARAMRLGWSGDFEAAYLSLASSAERQTTSEQRALRWAEIASYAAAADLRETAAAAIGSARAALRAAERPGVTGVRVGLQLALASMLIGRRASARVFLDAVAAQLDRWPRWRAPHRLLEALLRRRPGDGEAEALLSLFDTMHDEGLGGLARTIETIPEKRFERRRAE